MYLGIDVGTSCVKAVLIEGRDVVVDQASAPLAISRLNPL
jgi:xylulokinase